MRVDAFDFELPEERIALHPASPRDAARMLVVKQGEPFRDHIVRDLPKLLKSGDILVLNDTKVIPAQLSGSRERDGSTVAVGVTLIECTSDGRWWCFAKPGRRLKDGDRISFDDGCLSAEILEKGADGQVLIRFNHDRQETDAMLERIGAPPLPPYIASRRSASDADIADYQTIYAREPGAVAAPTAGLHFTERLFQDLDEAGIRRVFVTLHVGAGTFLPVKVADTDDHDMHAEYGEISQDTANTINEARKQGGRIVAVGTTSLRLLESAASGDGTVMPFAGETDIFITPGHRFRAIDLLMTNFHLPQSTLFMLVSAFSGLETMKQAYRHAIDHQYRFYSYGDACLLFPGGPDV